MFSHLSGKNVKIKDQALIVFLSDPDMVTSYFMLMVVAQCLRALNRAGKMLKLQFDANNLTFDISFYGSSIFALILNLKSLCLLVIILS